MPVYNGNLAPPSWQSTCPFFAFDFLDLTHYASGLFISFRFRHSFTRLVAVSRDWWLFLAIFDCFSRLVTVSQVENATGWTWFESRKDIFLHFFFSPKSCCVQQKNVRIFITNIHSVCLTHKMYNPCTAHRIDKSNALPKILPDMTFRSQEGLTLRLSSINMQMVSLNASVTLHQGSSAWALHATFGRSVGGIF